jgi:hypothetical protein
MRFNSVTGPLATGGGDFRYMPQSNTPSGVAASTPSGGDAGAAAVPGIEIARPGFESYCYVGLSDKAETPGIYDPNTHPSAGVTDNFFTAWWSTYWNQEQSTTANRIAGSAQAAGGLAETIIGATAVGAGIGFAGPTGGTSMIVTGVGIGVVGHGVDTTQAGVRQMLSGVQTQTATSSAIESVTGSKLAGELADLAVSLVNPNAVSKMLGSRGIVGLVVDGVKGLFKGKAKPNIVGPVQMTASQSKLQHEFKHAFQFGIEGNWNKANGAKFAEALQKHIDNTPGRDGTYRGIMKVTHYYDEKTKLNVMLDEHGNLVGAWKLAPRQWPHMDTDLNIE